MWVCSVRDMAPEDAEQRLIEWVTVTRDRDTRVRAAVAAGLSKHRVHRLTGIGRSGPTRPDQFKLDQCGRPVRVERRRTTVNCDPRGRGTRASGCGSLRP
jgi:hypothetical protein